MKNTPKSPTQSPAPVPRVNKTPAPNNPPPPNVIPFEPEEIQPTHRYPLRSKYSNAVINQETGKLEGYTALANGKDAKVWQDAYADDLGMLAQGIRDIKGTNTIHFISKDKVPKNKKVTYGKKEVSLRPNKARVHRVRLTVGGDKLDYAGDTKTQCASLTTVKILLNSTISTPGARFATIDMKEFYYGTPMSEYEYMKIQYSD